MFSCILMCLYIWLISTPEYAYLSQIKTRDDNIQIPEYVVELRTGTRNGTGGVRHGPLAHCLETYRAGGE